MQKVITVSIDQLYLDPNNPRLAGDFDFSKQPNKFSSIEKAQKDLLRRFTKETFGKDKEDDFFDLQTLINSFKRNGFLDTDRIICTEIADNKYLVLEGNRRTSAIKALSNEDFNGVEKDKVKSLKKIPITVIDPEGKSETEFQEEIAIILGLRHHGSLLEWPPLPASYNVFETYLNLEPKMGAFERESKRMKRTAETLSISLGKADTQIRTFIIFKQIERTFEELKPKHFSLIQALIQSKPVQREFIAFDPNTYEVDQNSIENFNILCEFADRDKEGFTEKKLKDPKAVRDLTKAVRYLNRPEERIAKMARQLMDDFLEGERALVTTRDAEGTPIKGILDDLKEAEAVRNWIAGLEKNIDRMKAELDPTKFADQPNNKMLKDGLEPGIRSVCGALGLT